MLYTNMPEIVITGLPAILIAFASALIITWYYIPKVINVVKARHLEDRPGYHKIHKYKVPTLGGIGIFGGFIFGFLIGIDGYMPGLSYFTAAVVFLLFVGIKDDLVYLNPKKKFLGELGAAVIVALFTNIHITHFHGFLGITDISSIASFIVTILLFIFIINAVNLIDGIDGLAASVGIIASVTFGVFFFLSGDYGYTVMAAALLGSLLAFLYYNMSNGPKKIFMGDSGSLVIGFTLAVFAIHFNEMVAAGDSVIKLKSAPSISIAILILPIFDLIRVAVLRMYAHKSIIIGDKQHIHHMMLRAGLKHWQATLIMSLFNIFIIGVAFLLDGLGIFLLGLLLLALCLIATGILSAIVKRKNAPVPKMVKVSEMAEVTGLN